MVRVRRAQLARQNLSGFFVDLASWLCLSCHRVIIRLVVTFILLLGSSEPFSIQSCPMFFAHSMGVIP